MAITGFNKEHVSDSRIYLGSEFATKSGWNLKDNKVARIVNGTVLNSDTSDTYTAQYSNSPWKTAEIKADENGNLYTSIPSTFKQFTVTKGVLDSSKEKPSTEKSSTVTLARTGGASDTSIGSRLVMFVFFFLACGLTAQVFQKKD